MLTEDLLDRVEALLRHLWSQKSELISHFHFDPLLVGLFPLATVLFDLCCRCRQTANKTRKMKEAVSLFMVVYFHLLRQLVVTLCWVCFFSVGTGQLIWNECWQVHPNLSLPKNLCLSARQKMMGRLFIFLLDKNSKHTGKRTNEKKMTVLQCVSQFPDLFWKSAAHCYYTYM